MRAMPERARDQIRDELDVDDRAVTMLECRPPWRADFGTEWTRFPIARLRYTKTRREWQIYWRDRNLKWAEGMPRSLKSTTIDASDFPPNTRAAARITSASSGTTSIRPCATRR